MVFFSGSFHSASKNTFPIWAKTAKLAFSNSKEEEFVRKQGHYDKSIIDCAFRADIMKRNDPNGYGGCHEFQPSLTTNGMCYTFNGKKTSEIWKPSRMTTTFEELFPSQSMNDKKFGGSRTTQGNQLQNAILH